MTRREKINELKMALSVGLVGGFVLGLREALLTVEANAFVQPETYFLPYLAGPILGWMTLGALLVLPVGAIFCLRSKRATTQRSPAVYALVVALAGTFSVVVPWVLTITTRLHAVGMTLGLIGSATLWLIAAGLVGAGTVMVAAVARWLGPRAQRPLRYATYATLLVGVLLLLPVGRFFATEWQWVAGDRPAANRSPERPNVLLISIDTLRADHLGSYGNTEKLTPSLDRLAREGVVFGQAITASPWTLPAMASLFTALYPHQHGAGAITNRRDPLGRSPLPPDAWTLATALHEHGYRTQAVVTNPYLAVQYGFGSGFDGYENVTIESEAFLALRNTTAVRLLRWLWPSLMIGDVGDTVSARAQRWLRQHGTDRPFFLWLHYVDPHLPYSRRGTTSQKSFRGDSLFGADGLEPEQIASTSPDAARLRSGEIRPSPEQKMAIQELYQEEVASVDAAVGAVLDTLDRVGLRDDTLVVCVADHGEEFWEHGGVEHGHTLYDELLHIPLLMRWPGHLPAGVRRDEVVRLIDVAPTIIDLVQLRRPVQREGTSLLPLIRGDERVPRVALAENLLFAAERVAIRTSDAKYILWENGKEEAYDLGTDPKEQRDVSALTTMTIPLRELYADIAKGTPAPSLALRERRPTTAHSEALRALGYVQ